MTPTPRWAIRVTYSSGEEAWLRHGGTVGEGPIVQFRTKRLADLNAELVQAGLDVGETLTVVRLASLADADAVDIAAARSSG